METYTKLEKAIMIIVPPSQEERGAYLLIIHRPSSSLGDSPGIPVPIDRFTSSGDEYVGYRDGELVVQFPKTTSYILLLRDRVRFLDPVELATEELAMRQGLGKLRQLCESEEKAPQEVPSLLGHPGTYL